MGCMASPWKHPDSGIYYHRVGVPSDIREQVGKTVIKFSLGTRDLAEAKRLFASHYAETQALFLQARNKTTLTHKDIQALAQRWLRESLERMENEGNFTHYLAQVSGEGVQVASFIIAEALEAGYVKQRKLVGYYVDTLLADNNLLVDEGSTQYKELTECICWRLMELSQLAEDRHFGKWDSEPQVSERLLSHQLSVEAATPTYKPLGKIIEEFTKYKTHRGDWEGKTLRDPVGVYTQFAQFIGADVDPSAITREHFRDFISLLHQLPQRYTIKKELCDKSFAELVEIAADNELPLLAPNTVRKKFVFIKSLFSHAFQEEWVDRNRTEGIDVPKGKEKTRVPFEREEMQIILDATQGAERRSDYWCPRIALTTGMRSNEILQLTKDDVREESGVWLIDVNTDVDVETGKRKKAKTGNSVRKVPVPQVLIDAGFLCHVDSIQDGRLFPCVELAKADGTYSFTYSKRFNPMLARLGLKPELDELVIKDFHSLRHTFRANARAYGVAQEYANLIGGWKDQKERTSGDSYGLHYATFIAKLRDCVNQIDYSELVF